MAERRDRRVRDLPIGRVESEIQRTLRDRLDPEEVRNLSLSQIEQAQRRALDELGFLDDLIPDLPDIDCKLVCTFVYPPGTVTCRLECSFGF